jgi:pimeloyl-ACP methyl ester carboxylesterase
MQLAIPDSVIAALLGLATRTDSTELLPTIEVPTAVVYGEEDKVVPPGQREALWQGIAGSEHTIIQGAGHLANLERPEEFNAAVERLIERVEEHELAVRP